MSTETVFWLCAIAGTAIFAVRVVLIFTGLGFDHADAGDFDHGGGDFGLVSFTSVNGFLMMFGWSGLAAHRQFQLGWLPSMAIAFACGLLMMFMVAAVFYMLRRMSSEGAHFKIEDTIGLNAKVYRRIPSQGEGVIEINIGGMLRELGARSEDGVDIDSFKPVKVVRAIDASTVSVKVMQ